MNQKTLEAVKRHGESLLLAFPNATEQNPVALCKKLRRIENSIAPILLQACNGPEVPEDKLAAACEKARNRAARLLGITDNEQIVTGIHVNRDPRGYALKLNDDWTCKYNDEQYADGGHPLYTDMGGYGILAPDLNQ